MVEYHGWLVLAQSLDGENENGIDELVNRLKSIISEIEFDRRILILKGINGSYILSTNGISNHFTIDVQEILDLFKFVADNALGSYGLLYIRNDEDEDKWNEFTVWKLAKGEFLPLKDNLLSPCNPVIEL